MKLFAIVLSAVIGAGWTVSGQVSLHKQELDDQGSSAAEIRVETLDRDFVPLKLETKQLKVSDTETRTETVTQTRLASGQYFPSARSTTISQQVAPGETQSRTEVINTDRQGGTRLTRTVSETVKETENGMQKQIIESLPNQKREFVPARQTTEISQKRPDGSVQTQREVRELTVNGEMALQKKVEEKVIPKNPNESVTQTITFSVNHMNGQLTETARETTVRRTQGNMVESERVISQPRGTAWDVRMKVLTTEQKAADGSTQREVIKYERPTHAAFSATSTEPLKPKLKIVEHTVAGPGGTSVLQRDVYFRDVNNEWRPHSFSTNIDDTSADNYGR